MAARLRALEWRSTSLGPPQRWPSSFRTACRICLTSRFPMILFLGPQLAVVYNDAYVPMLGAKHPAPAKAGQQVWEEIWHIVGPMLDGVLKTGEATWSDDLLLPMDRHGYREEAYFTYSCSPLHDDDGAVGGVFTAVTETTQRVVGERRLAVLQDLGGQAGIARTVEEACQLVVASLARAAADVPFAAIYLRERGTDGVVLTASSPAYSEPQPLPDGPGGWPLTEVLRENQSMVLNDVYQRFGELPRGTWSTPPVEAMVLPLRGHTRAETLGAMVLGASAGRTMDGAYRSFLSQVVEQTAALVNGAAAYEAQQRRLEELAELDRAKTAFFSNVSHEFRTPLTLLMGPVAELRSAAKDDGDPRRREELDVIHRNGLRLAKLVNTLLDFSRIQAGRAQASYEPVELSTVTAELAGLFRAAVEKAGLTFDVDCPALDEPVYVDREMWEEIVLNLLSNALKFTFVGAIRISLRQEAGWAVLRIADTGIGVPKEEIPRLFERFHRVERTRARSNEGSGIGLALVQELVALHAGTISAESVVDAGTTFTVRLPLGHAHLPAERLPPAAAATGDSLAGVEPFIQEALRWLPNDDITRAEPAGDRSAEPAERSDRLPRDRVLIADDNADMREYLQRLLSPHFAVHAVSDGMAALAAARAEPPDLIVSDVMMPGLDGIDLVGALRADPSAARVPVLLLSARAGQEASIEGLAAGADDYMVKPFSSQELLARIRANLRLARLRNHHADWRVALINSIQQGFFVCDPSGAVVEINDAFTALLGFGADGLPYHPPFPWWPDATTDPAGHKQIAEAFDRAMHDPGSGAFTVPLRHSDGRPLWVAVTSNPVPDPDSGERMLVGTLRDVTAERLAGEREAALRRLTARLSEAGSLREVIDAGLDELRGLWHARRGLAAIWDGAGHVSLASTPAEVTWHDLDDSVRKAMTRTRDGRSLQVRVRTKRSASTGVVGAGTRLDYGDGVVVIWQEFDPARSFGAEDRAQLALLCGYLGQALNRARVSDEQRTVALALQRSILGPTDLPPGFAVRYEPAVRPLEVGGDWYDVVELADDRIGLVVGDCVGRGLPAATVMGQLRSACRALLLQAASPGEILTALDSFATLIPAARCTTLFCGVLDRADGRLRYASAGHPPAIVVHLDGTSEVLDRARSMPLAIPGDRRAEATVGLRPGSVLLLYTDGLIERRAQPLDTGIAQATSAVVAGRAAPVVQLPDQIMASLLPDEGYSDDVAVLLYRHPGHDPVRFVISFDAQPGELATARHALRAWLEELGLDRSAVSNALVATTEACANSIEHGYRFAPGHHVLVTAYTIDSDLHITVTDTGRWKSPQAGSTLDRGRGIPIMRGLAANLTIDTTAAGTTAQIRIGIGDGH